MKMEKSVKKVDKLSRFLVIEKWCFVVKMRGERERERGKEMQLLRVVVRKC